MATKVYRQADFITIEKPGEDGVISVNSFRYYFVAGQVYLEDTVTKRIVTDVFANIQNQAGDPIGGTEELITDYLNSISATSVSGGASSLNQQTQITSADLTNLNLAKKPMRYIDISISNSGSQPPAFPFLVSNVGAWGINVPVFFTPILVTTTAELATVLNNNIFETSICFSARNSTTLWIESCADSDVSAQPGLPSLDFGDVGTWGVASFVFGIDWFVDATQIASNLDWIQKDLERLYSLTTKMAKLTDTQPVSVVTQPLPTGAATLAKQDQEIALLQAISDSVGNDGYSPYSIDSNTYSHNIVATNVETFLCAFRVKPGQVSATIKKMQVFIQGITNDDFVVRLALNKVLSTPLTNVNFVDIGNGSKLQVARPNVAGVAVLPITTSGGKQTFSKQGRFQTNIDLVEDTAMVMPEGVIYYCLLLGRSAALAVYDSYNWVEK